MKIAKADDQDIKAALDLVSLVENVSKGYYPESPNDGNNTPTFFDEDDKDHLRLFYDRVMACTEAAPGGLFRVAFGFATIADARNNIINPDADTLELHPKIVGALEALEPAEGSNS